MGQSPNGESYTNNPNDNILIQGNADLKDGKVCPRIWTTEITKTSEPNDIIFTVRAPVGDLAINHYNAVIGRGVASLRANLYIYYYLKKLKYDHYWEQLSSGSTFDSINSNELSQTDIYSPIVDEQKCIGKMFCKIDDLITLHQRVYNFYNYWNLSGIYCRYYLFIYV